MLKYIVFFHCNFSKFYFALRISDIFIEVETTRDFPVALLLTLKLFIKYTTACKKAKFFF